MTSRDAQGFAVTLFYSYAHEDESLRDELAGHLKILERRGLIQAWHDRKIVPGQDWATAIDTNLGKADLVLLLVSKDFIESDYIFGVELRRAMQRHSEKSCEVVPIIVRAVNIEPEDAEDLTFLKLQCLPTDLKAVTSWSNRDEAWTNVAKGLRSAVSRIREQRPRSSTATALPPASPNTLPSVHVHPQISPTSDEPVDADVALDGIVRDVITKIDEAEIERSGRAVLEWVRDQLVQDTRTLIDLPDQKRVLWVDDRPESNRRESAAFAKLQIEVVAVQSTGQALLRIGIDQQSGESFDLVLTDWSRPDEGPNAALTLLAKLREAGHFMPVVIYHGALEGERRAERAALASAAGANGEAVLPSELMRLVLQALAGAQRDLMTAVFLGDEEEQSSIAYTLRSSQARTEVRAEQALGSLLRELVLRAWNDQDRRFGCTLFKLLIPSEMAPFLVGTADMCVEVDTHTAAIPWELLATPVDSDVSAEDLPWSIRRRLLRRLRLENVRGVVKAAAHDDSVLVIGEPKVDSKRYPALPAARDEALTVAAKLGERASGLEVCLLSEADAQAIVNALFERPWRAIHIAGHGYAGEDAGVVLSENTHLGANELRAMRIVPELVFINCCHVPVLAADALLSSTRYDRAKFAANIAEGLTKAGVRCVIVAGWAIENVPAAEFATAFYATLLRGERFINAVTAARMAAYRSNPLGNTWAAYQCYGDPEWTWRRDALPLAAPGQVPTLPHPKP